ncbi:MAG TPA: hypothetical protein DEB39_07745 [Planctomycetaceae bacterium]|nr:hypothetical protein [Planctomycetaceae bacterium]
MGTTVGLRPIFFSSAGHDRFSLNHPGLYRKRLETVPANNRLALERNVQPDIDTEAGPVFRLVRPFTLRAALCPVGGLLESRLREISMIFSIQWISSRTLWRVSATSSLHQTTDSTAFPV